MPLKKGLKSKVLKTLAALAAIWAVDYADILTRIGDMLLSFF